jgi:DNA-binding winged helix-turn-helix (wHTH) protein
MQLQSIVRGEKREPTGQHNSGILGQHAGPSPADTTLEFGRFCILTRRRQLLADGVPVELGTRAFDLLMVLIDADGALVTRDELLALVWPGIFVDASSLKVQVCALRKALGEDRDFIRTEFGRGYRFTAAISSIATVPENPRPMRRKQRSRREGRRNRPFGNHRAIRVPRGQTGGGEQPARHAPDERSRSTPIKALSVISPPRLAQAPRRPKILVSIRGPAEVL